MRHVRAHAGVLTPYLKKEGCGAGLLVGAEDFPYQHEAQKDRSGWSQWGQSWCMRALLCGYFLVESDARKAVLRAG